MKKSLFILFVFSFLISCGPHRMSCGARGICNASEKQIEKQTKINYNTSTVKI
ncbi:MAG TPA: hypothetical protein VLR29_04865 [Flavobacterium sp.]|nr:hypothetical protein [Flavobacterium sp.]